MLANAITRFRTEYTKYKNRYNRRDMPDLPNMNTIESIICFQKQLQEDYLDPIQEGNIGLMIPSYKHLEKLIYRENVNDVIVSEAWDLHIVESIHIS